jgi:hypothetical protein
VRRQAYIQYSLWPARHASPSHIHLSAPRHRPLTPKFPVGSGNLGIVAEYSIGLRFAVRSFSLATLAAGGHGVHLYRAQIRFGMHSNLSSGELILLVVSQVSKDNRLQIHMA